MKEKEILLQYINQFAGTDIAVAFSGGVDSSLLLKLCCETAAMWNGVVYGVTFNTKLHPAGDVQIARRVAQQTGARHIVIELDELDNAGIDNNPEDRCYRCKKYLFSRLIKKAKELGAATIIEGSNLDDTRTYRPGLRAVKELGVISPLMACGITKAQVRAMASEYGIEVADRPSTPCLATRFPYGTHIDYEVMERVDEAEQYLRNMGIANVRVRVYEDLVRIECDRDRMNVLMDNRECVTEYFKELGFHYITLDLEGFRSGSMDIVINQKNT